MSATSRVFITQESDKLNFTSAEKFGEVVFLTRDELSHIKGSLINSAITQEIRGKLAGFDPNQDYIAPAGSPVVTGLAFLLLSERLHGQPVRVLRWSNRDREYAPITLQV